MKINLTALILFLFACQTSALAQQNLPENIFNVTTIIEQPVSGLKGKNYFLCAENKPCSTEDSVREFYESKGYKVMRGEVTFWQGMFALAFYDEIFSIYTDDYNDIPSDMFSETCIEFFQTPIVQDFLQRIDNKTFAKIVFRIAQNPYKNYTSKIMTYSLKLNP